MSTSQSRKKQIIADLPHGVSIFKDKPGYRVVLGKKFTGGKVIKKRFGNSAAAREWIFGDAQKSRVAVPAIIDLKKDAGAAGFKFSTNQLALAAAAIKQLEDAGLAADKVTEAVEFYIRHTQPVGGKKTFKEAAAAYLDYQRKNMASKRHVSTLIYHFGKFGAKFGIRHLYEVYKPEIETWLESLPVANITKAALIRDLSALFVFGKKHQWVAENPFDTIQKPRKNRDAEVQILSPKDTRKLLQTALEADTKLATGLALQAFAGIRSAEVLRLKWDNINWETNEIFIPARADKTARGRVIAVSANLQFWLQACRPPIEAQTENRKIIGYGVRWWHRKIEEVAKLAGIKIPHNALRHSYGTYHYAKNRNQALTTANMGNSAGVFHHHYRKPVSAAIAETYWGIKPAEIAPKNVVIFA